MDIKSTGRLSPATDYIAYMLRSIASKYGPRTEYIPTKKDFGV